MRPLTDAIAAWTEAERPNRTLIVAVAAASAVALIYASVWVRRTVAPLTTAVPPAELVDQGPDGERFGLPLAKRREIFTEFATAEPNSRSQGVAGFPGQPWSQEDHRCAFERETARTMAVRHGISLTQVYLVLDEGIREKWLGPDGKPLPPKTVPLLPRRK